MNKRSIIKRIKMMNHAPIKAGRSDILCARACYVDRWYFSAFVVISVFVVAS